jgi:hypothetical protein
MWFGVRSSPISLLFTKRNRICSNRFCQISSLCYRCPLVERWFIFCLQNHKMCGYKRRPVHVVARFHFCLQNGTEFAVTGFVKSRACVIDARW